MTVKRVALVAFALALAFGGALLGLLLWLGAATSGPRIPAYPNPRTAVVVVDVQEDFTGHCVKQQVGFTS